MTELSIIIPTFNCMAGKKNSLELVLLSIENQNTDKDKIELVFVDNGSTDNTLAFLEKWIKTSTSQFGNLQLCHNPDSLNRSKTRNMGVETAKGEKLLFMDDDTILFYKNTLETLLMDFYEQNTFFCGAQRYWTRAEWEFSYIKQSLINNADINAFAFLPKGISRETGYRDLQEFSFIGNFGGLMKEDFLKVGGFDSKRFPGRQEDVDLMYRLLLNNFMYKLLNDKVKTIHLTHPITGNRSDERQHWFEEFRKKEHEEGYWFCINHLFRVFEDYGEFHPVLKKMS